MKTLFAIIIVVVATAAVAASTGAVASATSTSIFRAVARLGSRTTPRIDPSLLLVLETAQSRVRPGLKRKDRQRTLQTSSVTPDDGECVDAPFLWLIRNDNNGGTVEGVGVGTIHLTRRFVMTDNEWQSLVNAADDGCTIFAEFDLDNIAELNNVLLNCPVSTDVTYLADIPDPTFQAEVRNIVTQMVEEYVPFGSEQIVESILTLNPFDALFQLIAYWNIQNNLEIREEFFENLFNSIATTDFLDTELVGLGFDAGGLETADETCSYIQALQSPPKQEFVSNWDELYADDAWTKLNNTMDTLLDSYQCGDIDKLNEAFTASLLSDVWDDEEEVLAALLDVRNAKMAERMVLAMGASEHIPMFAVGAAHWFIGENSLANILQQYGYSLERVLEPYEESLFPDAQCELEPILETTDEPIVTTNAPVTEPTSAPIPEPTDETVTATVATASPTPESTSASTTESTSEPSSANTPWISPQLSVTTVMSMFSVVVFFVT
eukprot:CAMPEP_0113443446 /NCGR_PEP_ID=MMETSP0014_2-20120614/2143_1 /TAXON_ID=2857 /ORGANISM="Nitzschia sp." /LENGTH=494 /DNA_ID=CAMNT_0000334403 /DNA_START=1 /DNA_END=1481 /DNA_ORIENTATION=+ /assembly_acc=CAM_ASM_000159